MLLSNWWWKPKLNKINRILRFMFVLIHEWFHLFLCNVTVYNCHFWLFIVPKHSQTTFHFSTALSQLGCVSQISTWRSRAAGCCSPSDHSSARRLLMRESRENNKVHAQFLMWRFHSVTALHFHMRCYSWNNADMNHQAANISWKHSHVSHVLITHLQEDSLYFLRQYCKGTQ